MDQKFILKTLADCSIAGLVSIGIFQSPTFTVQSWTGYLILMATLLIVVFLAATYALRFHQQNAILGLTIALIVSALETFIIGYGLGHSISIITIVWFATIPSVIIFDKILG